MQVRLEITRPEGRQVEGVVTDAHLGRAMAFQGWLQLLDLLEESLRLDPGSATTEPRPPEELEP